MITALFLILIIGVVGVISELLSKKGILDVEISRKFLHFTAGSAAAFSVLLIENRDILLIFGSVSSIIAGLLVYLKILQPVRSSSSKSWGIFFLPIAFFLLLFFFFPKYNEIIFLSMLILGIADAAAAVFGSFISQSYFNLTKDKKSIVGSVTFFFSTFTIVIIFFAGIIQFQMLPHIFFGLADILLFALCISFILTILEALCSHGFDNFTIPIFTAIIFYVFAITTDSGLIRQFAVGVFLAAVVSLLSVYFNFLTLNGSAITFLLASFIFGFGGWKWALPIMAFFILSSLLSKLRSTQNEKVDTYFEKSSTRDYLQVLANGGIGGVLVVWNHINPSEINYYIYLASLAAVCADTWATEIGTLRIRPTYNILTFKRIEQGVSGGVSLVGTMGAILGSIVIVLSGIFWVNINLDFYIILIISAGFIGSLLDSVMGATIQSQSICGVCKKITEKSVHCDEVTSHHRGFKILNNDAVNFLSGLASAVFIILIYYFN